MASGVRRRLCKFIPEWTRFEEYSSWLVPIRGEKHRAYCLLCKKAFAISHGGLNDVKAHYKGKKHIWLQRQQEQLGTTAGPSEQEGRVDLRAQFTRLSEKVSLKREIQEPHISLDSFDSSFECSFPKSQVSELWTNGGMNTPHKMLAQQYCLRWKYHHNNLQSMFGQLLERESFCDVTLACEGRTLRAHKVVLSACSTYFDSIFSQYEGENPIVILKDVKFSDIRALVEFMYKGEINIDHSHLASLLKTAEDLRIKGLAEVSWRSEEPVDGGQPLEEDPVSIPEDLVEPPLKKRRGRPQMDTFCPKVTSIVGGVGTEEEFSHQDDAEVITADDSIPEWEEVQDVIPVEHNQDRPQATTPAPPESNSESPEEEQHMKTPVTPASGTESSTITPRLEDQYRDVIKLNDYLTTGRRPQFWEEPFTRRIMEAIKSKELEMKTGAELLGVSYGTLYGRYRDAYGCLKHPYSTPHTVRL